MDGRGGGSSAGSEEQMETSSKVQSGWSRKFKEPEFYVVCCAPAGSCSGWHSPQLFGLLLNGSKESEKKKKKESRKERKKERKWSGGRIRRTTRPVREHDRT